MLNWLRRWLGVKEQCKHPAYYRTFMKHLDRDTNMYMCRKCKEPFIVSQSITFIKRDE